MKKITRSIALTSATVLLTLPQVGLALSDAVKLQFESRLNYRDSANESFPIAFPPGASLDTVDSGRSFEVSNITFQGRFQLSKNWLVISKIDFIDLYERNPTSSDQKVDLDTFIIRYGQRHANGLLPEKATFYGQLGKFGKFERQEDRHLESYGLVSTSFNRLEDSGLEFGFDLASGFYSKLSYTTGNPLFFRDPNALAGDNGVGIGDNKDKAELQSGTVILYDAEVETIDLNKNPELGLGLGYRWVSDNTDTRVNTLIHYNERDLADTVELNGTGYGGDLDILAVTSAEVPPVGTVFGLSSVGPTLKGKKKKEIGATLWLYHKDFTLFGQYVDQETAGLTRTGWEVETSYKFFGVPGFASITPALRYSRLAPEFTTIPQFPSQSILWKWEKIDYGVNFDFNQYVRLTVEHSENNFIVNRKKESNDETLITLRLKYAI